MPSPLIFLIGFFLIDYIYKKYSESNKIKDTKFNQGREITQSKLKNKVTFTDLVRRFEQQFQQSEDTENINDKPLIKKSVNSEVKREGLGNQSRYSLIEKQRDKEREHSNFDKYQRLERGDVMKKPRLSDSQAHLVDQLPNRSRAEYDLDTRRNVSIETIETINVSNDMSQSNSYRYLNIKDDILKGFIYSEILSKPKSLKK